MTSAASDFMNFIKRLNRDSIPYFIAWGYEKLPKQRSGGDVDIYIHPQYYSTVAKELIDSGYSSGKCPAYSENHKHEQFTRVGNHTLDLFSSFCFSFGGKTTLLSIEPRYFLENRLCVNEMWVANPVLEMLFTSLRIVGGRKDPLNRLKKYLEEAK